MPSHPGQPTKYRPEYCKIAQDILAEDRPYCAVAAALHVSEDTIRNWKREIPEFFESCKKGKAIGKEVFLEKMRKAAWDAEKHRVNNGLINLLAINNYEMRTAKSERKDKVDLSGSIETRSIKVEFVDSDAKKN